MKSVGLIAILGALAVAPAFGQPPAVRRLTVDETQIKAAGLRIIKSKHLTLITDVPDRSDIDELGLVFDQAVPQWCAYFGIGVTRAADWKTVGCVMLDKEKFRRADLLPDDLPPFPAGFQRGGDMWLLAQPGEYYTRHLLLHEGTHGFMEEFLGGYGPPWYAEGLAELLALHVWKSGQLKLKARITDRNQVPYWGRVKIIRDDGRGGDMLSIDQVLETPNESFQLVRYYAWAWAACEFFDTHPDFQPTFRSFKDQVREPHAEFNRRLKTQFANRWNEIAKQWGWLVEEMDYGYDVARAVPAPVMNPSSDGEAVAFAVSAQRGWQSTGLQVDARRPYLFQVAGQFQIKHDAQPWIVESGGVTIEYYGGRPLGQLIASIDAAGAPPQIVAIGRGGKIRFPQSGELFLRINESPAQWDDNRGKLDVRVIPKSD